MQCKIAIQVEQAKRMKSEMEKEPRATDGAIDVQTDAAPLGKETRELEIVTGEDLVVIYDKILAAASAWHTVVAKLDTVFIKSYYDGTTLLHLFAGVSSTSGFIAYLLEAGIPVDVKNKYDMTALHCAAGRGGLADCKILCAHGADINAHPVLGPSPFEVAVNCENPVVSRWLLHHPRFHRHWSDQLFAKICAKGVSLIVPYLNVFAVEVNGDPLQMCHLPQDALEPIQDDGTHFMVYYLQVAEIYGKSGVADSALAQVIKTPVACEALATRTMRNMIKTKWTAFGKAMFRQEIFLYSSLVVAFSISVIFDHAEAWNGFESKRQLVVGICRIIAAVSSGILLLRVERREATVEGPAYFFSFWNVLGFGTYVGIISVAIFQAYGANSDVLRIAVGVLNVTLWLNMFQYLQMSKQAAVLVTMMSHMVNDVAKFILLYCIFLFGFSGGFYVLLFGNSGYETFIDALITVLLMLFGQITYDTFHAATGLTWFVSNLLLLAYLVSVVIVLLNLLIAMMSTSYSNVWEEAEGQVLLSYAQAIVRMEKSIANTDRMKLYEKLKLEGNRHAKSKAAWDALRKACFKAEKMASDFTFPFATRAMASLKRVLFGGIIALEPLIQRESQSPLASNIRTKCGTLQDGIRWEPKSTQTNTDQQAALNARVDSLAAVADQQTAQNKEQTTLIKEQAALLKEQTAVINELRDAVLALVAS